MYNYNISEEYGIRDVFEQIKKTTWEQVKKHPEKAEQILTEYKHMLIRNDLFDYNVECYVRLYTGKEFRELKKIETQKQIYEIWTKCKDWR